MPKIVAPLAGFALVVFLAVPGLARAQADSPQCRTECAAPFAERAQNTATIQACLVRCAARSAVLGSTNVAGTTAMPTPQTPWTTRPHQRAATREAGRPPAMDRQAGEARQAQTARRGGPAVPAAETPAGVAVQPAGVTAASVAPSSLGALMGTQAAVPPPDPQASPPGLFGAIYLAAAPSRAYGLALGAADRGAAHRAAESACHSGASRTCRLDGDFAARCATIVHGLRLNGAVVITAHPSTYTVVVATSGTGQSREVAERQALSACVQRGRGAVCQVTETRCVP